MRFNVSSFTYKTWRNELGPLTLAQITFDASKVGTGHLSLFFLIRYQLESNAQYH